MENWKSNQAFVSKQSFRKIWSKRYFVEIALLNYQINVKNNGCNIRSNPISMLSFSPNLNLGLIPVWNVVVESEEEHEAKEESKTAEEVPQVVIVKEVEARKTLFVCHLRVGSTHVGDLHLVVEEVDSRDKVKHMLVSLGAIHFGGCSLWD